MKYGDITVPYTASWTGEDRFEIRPCPYAEGRDALWQPHAPGMGKPMFATPHSVRQRQAMARQLCDICGRPLKNRTRVSMSQESPREVPGVGRVPLAVEPMVHRECGAEALRLCPSLKRQYANGRLRIRQVTACRLVAQGLTGEATMEFAGVYKPGAIGYLKLLITGWIDRDADWLERDRGNG